MLQNQCESNGMEKKNPKKQKPKRKTNTFRAFKNLCFFSLYISLFFSQIHTWGK